tara:strand:- start:219 stop:1379 length:1161 start_codon:yes stop_codon:yes gene_type:complete
MSDVFDIFIIGGGINGAGIARDASGRGLKVALCDKGKIGAATSSWSTKLIHGGLRYLENYEFGLVRESLNEREIIHQIAPNITKSLPFVIPHTKKLRPAWIIRLGLFIYDNLTRKNTISKSASINIQKKYKNILKSKFVNGFEYYDLQVDDQELVRLNALDAKKRGAKIFENSAVTKAERKLGNWEISFSDNKICKSKILINASGPWVNQVLNNVINLNEKKSMRLIKGSHIVTKKLYDMEVAFTLQNIDNRVVFTIPYKNNYTLIGTTEIEVSNPDENTIEENEIKYLIDCVNLYFIKSISKDDIVETFSGVRPLIASQLDNISRITRDYYLDLNLEKNKAPLLNIYGGKLTTYRKLSENAISKLKIFLPSMKANWTSKKPLILL